MPVLDPRTIDRFAELVCDLGGPYQRSGRQLTRLLEAAGWDVEYDGSTRVPWLAETIRHHNDDPEAIDALLRRVIDPREYDEGMPAAVAFVEPINALLIADGLVLQGHLHDPEFLDLRGCSRRCCCDQGSVPVVLEVGHAGQRTFVRRLDDPSDPAALNQVAARLASPELRATVRSLVRDPAMADILNARLDEVEASRNAGAYLLAVIGTGSFIEGLLHDVLRLRDPASRKQDKPTLDYLLQRAYARGWIQHDAHRFGGLVREYRNLVHPREQLLSRVVPDGDTVLMCWQPVLAVINDLQQLLPGPRST